MRNTTSKAVHDAIVDYWNTTTANDEYCDFTLTYCEKAAEELSFLGYEISAEEIYDLYGDLLAEEREELCFLG